MAGIDEKFIEELKYKANIVDIVGRYCVLKKKGSNYWACCPLPGHIEKTPSFTVNEMGGFYHCFGCDKGGDVIKFIQEVESLDFYEACKFLADIVKMPVPEFDNYNEDESKKLKERKDRLYAVLKETALYYVNNLKTKEGEKALKYLEKRKISPSTIKAFGLGASIGYNELPNYLKSKGYTDEEMLLAGVCQKNSKGNLFDAYANRLIVPIINTLGKVVAFGGRVLEKTEDNIGKYKNTTDTQIFSKKRTLYAINNLKKLKTDTDLKYVIMVEGYMDAISLYQAGFKNVVASMGTSLTLEQAKLLKRFVDKVVVSYDGDSAGQKATLRSLNIFSDEGFDVRVLSLPDGKDPDDVIKEYGKNYYQNLIDTAEPLIDFRLNVLLKGKNLKDPVDRRKYVAEGLEIIRSVSDAFMREELLKKLRDNSGITYESLKRDLDSGVTYQEESLNVINKPHIESDNNALAERFILLSILKNKPYATDFDVSEIYFSNDVRTIIADAMLDGQDVRIENLFSIVKEEGAVELNELLSSGDSVYDKGFEEKYFNDCVKLIKRSNLESEITKLNKEYLKQTDLQKRKEISLLIAKKTEKLLSI